MKEEAIDALEQVRDELRMAEQVRTPAAVDARPVEGSSETRPPRRAPAPRPPDARARRSRPLRPGRAGLAARVYALVLAATAVTLILLALRRAFPPERPLRDTRRAAPARRRPPASLDRIELEAALGVAGSFDLHFHFAPRLRSIASGLLASRRRISLETEPDAARAVLSDAAWDSCDPIAQPLRTD